MQCSWCDRKADVERESYRAFGAAVSLLAPPGHCVRCRQPFCSEHYGGTCRYDDDAGTLGESHVCQACVLVEDEGRRLRNAKREERALWWWRHVPLLGIPMYGLILLCRE